MDKITLRNITKSYDKNKPVIENLDLSIKQGSFTVLLGPSGCGKSTILRMIAGLEKEDSGDIEIDGVSMKGVEPGDHQIAMVFQNYALYPTMTVRENIEFGLKNMKVEKSERNKRIKEVAQMVNLEPYLERKPAQLSGGQRQRVALARAIVKKPSVFLMDEPLSNLDSKLRASIRTELIELYRKLGSTFVYVTHDQTEAMSMGTDIILLEEGKVRQHDTPIRLYNAPANVFSARFVGTPPMNILPVEVMKDAGIKYPSNAVSVGFRPEACSIGTGEMGTAGCLRLGGDLITREILGDQILYKVRTAFGNVQVKEFQQLMVEYGKVFIEAEASKLYYFDCENNLIAGNAEGV